MVQASYTALWQAILSLRDEEECEAFFADLCTARELSEFSARLEVARLLGEGVNYNEIARQTGASTATISRVSKALSGAAGGYRAVISRGEEALGLPKRKGEMLSLLPIERLAFSLIARFEAKGYSRYARSVFPESMLEEALGDVTPSLAGSLDPRGLRKYCYYQNILRREEKKRMLRCLSQVGIECLGALGAEEERELLSLATEALSLMHTRYELCITPLSFSDALLKRYGIFGAYRREVYELLRTAPSDLPEFLLSRGEAPQTAKILGGTLTAAYPFDRGIALLRETAVGEEETRAVDALGEMTAGMQTAHLRLDFTLRPARDYYEDIFFTGRIGAKDCEVLRGGRYDTLARRTDASGGAIGFAVYLDSIPKGAAL